MKLKRKVSLTIEVTLTCLIAIFYFVSHYITMDRVFKQEKIVVWRSIDAARDALSGELARLETIATDWVIFDGSRAVVKARGPGRDERRLTSASLAQMRIDMALCYDASGKLVFGVAAGEGGRVPAAFRNPDEVMRRLFARSARRPVRGIVSTPSGPVLMASRPVAQDGRALGAVVVARRLGRSTVRVLSRSADLPVAIQALDGKALPPDFAEARFALSKRAPNVVMPRTAQTVSGYGLLTDLSGRSCLILRVDVKRSLYAQGRRTALYLVGCILIVGLVFIILITALLERLVLSRLGRLGDDVSAIGASGDLSVRVAAEGHDELSLLASSVNGMLGALEKSAEDRKRAEDALRRRDAIMGAVAYAAEVFLKTDLWEDCMPAVLERLGEATGSGRVYVFENSSGRDGALTMSLRYEWVGAGVAPRAEEPDFQQLAYRAGGLSRWVETLGQGEAIHGRVRDFPAAEAAFLERDGALSVAVAPIFVGGHWWGLVGFEERKIERPWSPVEVGGAPGRGFHDRRGDLQAPVRGGTGPRAPAGGLHRRAHPAGPAPGPAPARLARAERGGPDYPVPGRWRRLLRLHTPGRGLPGRSGRRRDGQGHTRGAGGRGDEERDTARHHATRPCADGPALPGSAGDRGDAARDDNPEADSARERGDDVLPPAGPCGASRDLRGLRPHEDSALPAADRQVRDAPR